ncbi:DUF262 domain-containing protein [Nonlabens ponticola]|uniref:DUF262 domain-containing protein n=1 Tax=Nonlabens ponticola TaxID=2496866 RepID=A0A3S9N0B1_9FLAO|nr:DUF262 domain-containing protein [Nonlabens ponticola]AZQ44860.1 DUF262 domain-containing protein [Nonlabens ponticola]
MNISKESLIKLFNTGTNQYVIPFFQRPYVWKKEDCENLYEDLENTLRINKEKVISEHHKEHFIGTIITKNSPASTQMTAQYDLVDGQQRMTTFSLLIKALANNVDLSEENAGHLYENLNGSLFFKDAYGKIHNRIIHNRLDKKAFDLIMGSDGTTDKEIRDINNKIVDTYIYFRQKYSGLTNDELLERNFTLLHRFPAINMVLEQHDDEQEIFDTINSLGVKLTTSELLKNHIFSDKRSQELYTEYWEDIFEADEETVAFWNAKKTAGRVYRENIDVLLYCYLLIEKEKDVSLEHLFKDYKEWLSTKSFEEKQEFLKTLKNYADVYFNLPSGTELNNMRFSDNEKRFFHVIENLNITTIYPLVLYLYNNIEDEAEREKCFLLLESYLVRRAVCKLTTKNYNNLFISLIRQLKNGDSEQAISTRLNDILQGYSEDTARFPSDEDFRNGFHNTKLSNQQAREILFLISLYQINTVLHDLTTLSCNAFSTEHIMPKKWSENWFKDLTPEESFERNRKLLTLGNLTIITKNLNSKLRNSAWENKRSILNQYSSLPITTNYTSSEHWDEETISNRANDLTDLALVIWKKH